MDIYPAIWSAGSFTTGPGSTWQLNSITLRLDDFYSYNPDQVGFNLQTNNLGNPSGVSLATLSTTTNIGFEANHDFTPSTPLVLSPNTTYWVVGYPTNPTALYTWMVNEAATDNGTLGWSIGDDLAYSIDLGSNWGTNPGAPMMKIDATAIVAVPEPSNRAGRYRCSWFIGRRTSSSTINVASKLK